MNKTPKLRFKEFSEEWEIKKLRELDVLLVRGPFGSALKKDIMVPKSNDTYKVYEQKHAIQKDNTLGKYYITKDKYEELKRFSVNPGDYIMSCSGTIGELYKIPNNSEPGVINQALLKIKVGEALNEDYFSYIFKYNLKNLETKGSGIKNITSIKFLKDDFNISVPSKKEQEKIASFLSLFDEKIELQEQKVESLKKYKKGMMQKIFSQEIRFKDENGEDYPEWKEKRLDEISDIYQPQTISQTAFTEKGYIVYGANGPIGFYNKYNHETEQVIITCRGNTCGTVNFTTKFIWITGNAMVVNVDNYLNIVIKKYLKYIMEFTNLTYLITGSGQPQITKDVLSIHKIKLPSLPEQEKIASFLSTIDEKIELEQKKLSQLQEYKKGLLQQMFV